jgi:predicted outer membrane protein
LKRAIDSAAARQIIEFAVFNALFDFSLSDQASGVHVDSPCAMGIKSRMKWIAAIWTLGLIVSMYGVAQSAAVSSNDASFVQTAQSDLLGEYALAALASGKAANPQVKSLATQIATQTDKANIFIKKYAKAHDVSVDNKPTVRADAQYGDLQALSSSAFDQRFAQDLNVDAQFSLGDFQDEAQSGSDPTLRNFAKEEAQLLQQYSTDAQKISH